MARANQAADAPAAFVEARALVDLPAHGVKAGCLLVADADVIRGLAAAGEVDTDPAAVAYAKTIGKESD